MKNILIILWQLITYFVIGIPLRLIFKVKTSYRFKHQKGKKYIIAANHPARIDPFLISYSLPIREFIKIIPLRFITADEYMIKPLLRPLLLLYGCITTKKTSRGTVLERAVKLLDKGETVFIFPSGKLEKEDEKRTPRVGVAYLHKHVKNSKIIIVNIKYEKHPVRKTLIKIKSAEPITIYSDDLQKSANKIYQLTSS